MIPQSPIQELVTFGQFSIRVYGICIAVAIVTGFALFSRVAKRFRQSASLYLDAAFAAICSGFFGARIWHIWNEWWWYHNHLSDMFKFWNGGFALQGGLLFGLLGLVFFAKIKKISLLTLLDAAVVVLPVTQAIGRLGNYFNEELFGKPTSLPWALFISPEHRPTAFIDVSGFHPLFLYELLLNLLLFSILWGIMKKNPRTGTLLAIYLIGYGIIRFCLDFLRIDQYSISILTIAQWVSIVMVAIGGWLLYNKVKRRNAPDTEG